MSRPLVAWAAFAVLVTHGPASAQPDTALRPILDGLRARCIGPANMGGRIVDLAVVESNPDTFYVAAAGGGVWKTTDGGATFTPVFDDQPTLSIGAVAVCQGKPDVVYVGTGEGNPRNSVSWGSGVYKSADGGKTWTHRGLAATHHIGRIVVHPTDPDIAYVAAVGHFWGPNKERGLYKTTDGGKTWELAKFIDADTGFVDVQMDPTDPNTLYAAAWQVRRDGFAAGNPASQTGPNGGLFKTTDAGKTWEKLGGGLPDRPYGRCGLAVYRKDPNVVYAVVQTDKTVVTPTGQMPAELTKGPKAPPLGADAGGVFRSDDKGKTWKKLSDLVPRPFYYGQIRIDPTTDERIYVLGVGFYVSTDGGKTFAAPPIGAHPDHHALWIDPKNPSHMVLGNDGGLYASKNRGRSFDPLRNLVIGQFYGVAVDSRTPYWVYGGLQDNGSWGGPVATPYPDGITPADWRRVLGSDGFQCAVDPTDPNTVYAETQYGGLNRIDTRLPYLTKGAATSIRPPTPKGAFPDRFNWNAPILLSPHEPKTIFYGGQYLHRSADRGDTWERLSPDLTRAPKDGPVLDWGHTITALAESPLLAGVLWAGTDDGKIWVSRNGGKEWLDRSFDPPGVARDRWISRIVCSAFDGDTAYLAIDRHRHDDFKPYLYKTTDLGQTWTPLTAGLPVGAVVGVVRESSKNRDLLFAGTELGLYASLDGGKTWHHLNKTGLPANVRVDDVVIHPRERELVIGTHGRGIWVMDIAPLEQIVEKVLTASAHLFDVKPVTLLKEQKRDTHPPKGYVASNPPPGLSVYFLTNAKPAGDVRVTCIDAEGKAVGVYKGPGKSGLDWCAFDVKEVGEYTIALKSGEFVQTKKAIMKAE